MSETAIKNNGKKRKLVIMLSGAVGFVSAGAALAFLTKDKTVKHVTYPEKSTLSKEDFLDELNSDYSGYGYDLQTAEGRARLLHTIYYDSGSIEGDYDYITNAIKWIDAYGLEGKTMSQVVSECGLGDYISAADLATLNSSDAGAQEALISAMSEKWGCDFNYDPDALIYNCLNNGGDPQVMGKSFIQDIFIAQVSKGGMDSVDTSEPLELHRFSESKIEEGIDADDILDALYDYSYSHKGDTAGYGSIMNEGIKAMLYQSKVKGEYKDFSAFDALDDYSDTTAVQNYQSDRESTVYSILNKAMEDKYGVSGVDIGNTPVKNMYVDSNIKGVVADDKESYINTMEQLQNYVEYNGSMENVTTPEWIQTMVDDNLHSMPITTETTEQSDLSKSFDDTAQSTGTSGVRSSISSSLGISNNLLDCIVLSTVTAAVVATIARIVLNYRKPIALAVEGKARDVYISESEKEDSEGNGEKKE